MLLCLLTVICCVEVTRAQTTQPTFAVQLQSLLDAGKLVDAEALAKSADPSDSSARFALGIVQSLHGLEILSQNLYRYGADSKLGRAANLPMLRVPVPENPHPQQLTYDDARKALSDVIDQFDTAQATLETVKDPAVSLPLRLDTVRLNLTSDNQIQPAPLAEILGIVRSTNDEPTTQAAEPFVLHLDAGDVYWLRGYCHLLSAVGNLVLAYDEHELFDTTAHLFFAAPKTSYSFLKHGSDVSFDFPMIVDAVTVVHQMRFNVADPKRLLAARDHFRSTLQSSRESWRAILAETDNDHEWIPSPNQRSPLPTLQVTQDRVDAWLKFVDQADALLDGKVLLPFWRGDDATMGVNLAKAFTEPKPFDLVLWVQGSAAAPYLEKGPLTDKGVYDNLTRVFEGNVFTYAFWFN